MSLTYEQAAAWGTSRKQVFMEDSRRRHEYAWVFSGTADIYQIDTPDAVDVCRVLEDGNDTNEVGSLAALSSQDTSAVGAYFFDASAETLYVKAVDDGGINPFDHFYVATHVFRFDKEGAEDDNNDVHDARITTAPTQSIVASEVMDGRVLQTGSGSVGLENTDALISRRDLEPDGEVTFKERIGVFGDIP